MFSSRTLPVLLVAAAFGLATGACSSSSDQPSAATSSVEPSTTDAPTTSASATSSSTVPSTDTTAPRPQPPVAFSVYWTRPFGDSRPIDIPGHRDGEMPYPYVLYGSVTNQGEMAIDAPHVRIEWRRGDATLHSTEVAVQDPNGGPSAALAPGAIGDLIVVVDDATFGPQLGEADPQFTLVTS
jgi:hypothetical protein